MTTIYQSDEDKSDISPIETGPTATKESSPKTSPDVNDQDEDNIVIRQSYLLLVFRLTIGLILVGIIGVFLNIFSNFFYKIGIGRNLTSGTGSIIVIAFIYIIIFLVTMVKWKTTYYVLKKKSINSYQGLLRTTEHTLKYSTFSGIRVEQGILGKILNFGTIILEFEGKEGSTEPLPFFPKPQYYGDIIKTRTKNQ